MKKTIIIDATGSNRWIGGLYYKKNILYSLIQNNTIMSNFHIVVITEKSNKTIFMEFEKKIRMIYFSYKYQKERVLKLKLLCILNKSSYIFPCFDEKFCKKINAVGIYWIPDFQHYHLPQNFSDEERDNRRRQHLKIVKSTFPLVLSSNDCKNDFKTFCDMEKENIFVVPFVSYIENDIKNITTEYENKILEKNDLINRKYILICNQFWKHKNHAVVLDAIEYLAGKTKLDYIFVFTGKLQDNKDSEYINQIQERFNKKIIKDNSILLGFIDRLEQIVLMKNAEFIIQPSLFEGWGTVVEDAKVLDKAMLLSDIPIHREQKNEKCILFDPYDSCALAKLIENESLKPHLDNVDAGIEDMHKRAKDYSKDFEQMLSDLERK